MGRPPSTAHTGRATIAQTRATAEYILPSDAADRAQPISRLPSEMEQLMVVPAKISSPFVPLDRKHMLADK